MSEMPGENEAQNLPEGGVTDPMDGDLQPDLDDDLVVGDAIEEYEPYVEDDELFDVEETGDDPLEDEDA